MPEFATRRPLAAFLRLNPFPGKFTDGLYFRDKMRAIHRIAPERIGRDILEVGGGQSGLTKMLYPDAHITNLDMDPAFSQRPANRQPGMRFVQGDAAAMPFADESFDAVTMFDLLEHVPDDDAVARETLRVLRPGGWVLITTPDIDRWRYPVYSIFKPVCPTEEELFAEWGHVRRGYSMPRLEEMFRGAPRMKGGFINDKLALSHDIAFTKLPWPVRVLLHAAVAPVSIAGWMSQKPGDPGTEIAAAWQKGA
jgi:ubiquinone/menaquinone biosynthesis C-methylase UbiE